MRGEKKAFAYRVPIGDYNYLQCGARPKNVESTKDIIKIRLFLIYGQSILLLRLC